MNKIILALLMPLLIFACKKDIEESIDKKTKNNSEFSLGTDFTYQPSCEMANVSGYVSEIVSGFDFESMDFANATVFTFPEDTTRVYRIPLIGLDSLTDFVLVTGKDSVFQGKFVHIAYLNDYEEDLVIDARVYFESLDRTVTEDIEIEDNFRVDTVSTYSMIGPPPSSNFYWDNPDFIFYPGQNPLFNVVSWGNAFPGGSYYPGYGGYAPVTGGGGTAGNNPGCTPSVLPVTWDIIFNYNSGPAVDPAKLFKCFDDLPNTGATYEITLHSDLPVNSSPNQLATIPDGDPGHVFLTVTKYSGNFVLSQSFGFYPENGPKSMHTFPVPQKIVENDNYEYNASIKMSMTQSDFDQVRSLAISLAANKYDLNDFNCTDYALDIVNSIRSEALMVPIRLEVNPLAPLTTISVGRTPNSLYSVLKYMKDNNDPEAANIFYGTARSGPNRGECQ